MSSNSSEDDGWLEQLPLHAQRLLDKVKLVEIDSNALALFSKALPSQSFTPPQPRIFPLRFADVRAEINFIATYHLLNFGSAYNSQLLKSVGRDCMDTIDYGLMGLYFTKNFDAEMMIGMSTMEVASCFGLQRAIHEDFELQPGIHSERKTTLYGFCDMVANTLQQTGDQLFKLACNDFYDFITKHLPSSSASSSSSTAAHLIAQLVRWFPAFNDRYEVAVDAENNIKLQIAFHRKAQLLALDLFSRFHTTDSRFAFSDVSRLLSFTDVRIIPSLLLQHKIIKLVDNTLADKLETLQPLVQMEEVSIRCAIVVVSSHMHHLLLNQHSATSLSSSSSSPISAATDTTTGISSTPTAASASSSSSSSSSSSLSSSSSTSSSVSLMEVQHFLWSHARSDADLQRTPTFSPRTSSLAL